MQHFHSPQLLAQAMARYPVLEREASSFFLGGKRGAAWSIEVEGVRHVVALREDGVCAVFAEKAKAATAHARFAAIASTALAPLVGVVRPGRAPIARV